MARVALVTGGTRGIGAAIAKKLKEDGNTVVVCDVVEDQIKSFADATGIAGYNINIADHASVAEGAEKIKSDVGPVDILVNNAGITRDGIMTKMTREKNWDPIIAVNLGGVFNTCNVFLPGMNERKWGRIVNISSMNGQRGQPGQTNYSATKAGVIGFSRSLALEAARSGVTVNCICPGFILTEMTAAMKPEMLEAMVKMIPLGRIGQPEDIANGVSFLTQESSGWITGETMSINGGQFMY
ncbi:MAG: 3-oxoacyl-ACP reductase [Rhodospirillales bacterium]|nr:3-oxoacyl-ACP reductase [Rhodospirillales bacterium]